VIAHAQVDVTELFEGMDGLEAAAFGGAEKVRSKNLRFRLYNR